MATVGSGSIRRRRREDDDDDEEDDDELRQPTQRRRIEIDPQDVTMVEVADSTTPTVMSPPSITDNSRQQTRATRIQADRERLRREQQMERDKVRDRIFSRNRRPTAETPMTVAPTTSYSPTTYSPSRAIEPSSSPPPPRNLPEPSPSDNFSIDVVPYQRALHFKHVMRIIDVCTGATSNNNVRQWCGLTTFLKYYFASTLKIFLGQSSIVRIFLMHSDKEIGAKLYRIGGERYVLSLLANFDYWEKIGTVAASLPDIYFRPVSKVSVYTDDSRKDFTLAGRVQTGQLHDYGTLLESSALSSSLSSSRDRKYSRVSGGGGLSIPVVDVDFNEYNNRNEYNSEDEEATTDDDTDAVNLAVIDKAVMSLCLVHLFEIYIQRDLKNKVPNYVTIAKLFSDNSDSINPFRINLRAAH